MFSGIVEEIGRVTEWDRGTGRLVIAGKQVISTDGQLKISDSISVSGACLTVTDIKDGLFTVGLSPETISRTWFDTLRVGSEVNLERALRYGDRVGGHLVQGHVDTTGEVVEVRPDGDSKLVTIRCPTESMRYVVEKGFVAVDGTSLTCFSCTEESFTFSLIEYTASHTTIGSLRIGDRVNIETDLTAKYVERFVAYLH